MDPSARTEETELEKAKKLMLKWRRDPLAFNEHIWGDWQQPWEKQLDIWHSVRDYKRTTVRSGHCVGKSAIASRIAVWYGVCHPQSIVITTAPTARQVDEILWGELRWNYNNARYRLGGTLAPKASSLHFGDKWRIFGFTTTKGQASDLSQPKMAGFHAPYMLIIIDEAAGVEKSVFDEAEALTAGGDCRILAIGNPTSGPKHEFTKTFEAPAGHQLAGWNKLKISVLDSPNVKAGREVIPGLVGYNWPEEMKIKWGEDSPLYQAKVLAEFPDETEHTLIPLRYLNAALERRIEDIPKAQRPKANRLGVDPAWTGADASTGYWLDGPCAKKLFSKRNLDPTELAMVIKDLYKEHKFESVAIDANGIGAGVWSNVKRMIPEHKVRKIMSQARSHDPTEYYNLRTELAFLLAQRFIDGDIIIEDEELVSQLCGWEWEMIHKGGNWVRFLEEKAKIKKKIGRSPDDAEALMYANYAPKKREWSKGISFH